MSFMEKLDDEAMAFFNDVAGRPFSQQAVAFLNAYWNEVGSQADWIFSIAWEVCKLADMQAKKIQLVHMYEEDINIDFDMGIYFFEQLCKFWEEPQHNFFAKTLGTWAIENPNYKEDFKMSMPAMMTSIVRKKELREKVDVNFDGRVSFLEYLLYQYKDVANPADFARRAMTSNHDEHPEIKAARLALEEVNNRIREYECYKAQLEADAELPGVKGLRAKNLLAQLESSPLCEELRKALITAEAAVRRAVKLFAGKTAEDGGGPNDGALWWMQKDLEMKKKKYGARKK